MKKIVIGLAGLLLPLLVSGNAAAWAHANPHGGATYHAPGSGFDHSYRCCGWQRNAHVRSGNNGHRPLRRHGHPPGGIGANHRQQSIRRQRDAHRGPRHVRHRRVRRLGLPRRGIRLHQLHQRLGGHRVPQPLLRRGLSRVPSADHGECLWLGLLQLRRLEHRGGSGRGRRRWDGGGRGSSLREHRERVQRGRRGWGDRFCSRRGGAGKHRVRHGRDLRDATCRVYHPECPRQHVLPLRQQLVPAILRRERRLLPRDPRALSSFSVSRGG